MDRIEVKIDERTIREAERILRAVPGGVERAFPRAINRVVSFAATDLKRKVAEVIPAKLGEIAKAISRIRATRSNWYGAVAAQTHRIPVGKYKGTRQTRKGVTFRSARTQARELIEGGFFATMPTGHRGVFARKTGDRLPIVERLGPSVWQAIVGQEEIIGKVMNTAGKKLAQQLDHEVGYQLRRWAKR